jgi:hypothetical protein
VPTDDRPPGSDHSYRAPTVRGRTSDWLSGPAEWVPVGFRLGEHRDDMTAKAPNQGPWRVTVTPNPYSQPVLEDALSVPTPSGSDHPHGCHTSGGADRSTGDGDRLVEDHPYVLLRVQGHLHRYGGQQAITVYRRIGRGERRGGVLGADAGEDVGDRSPFAVVVPVGPAGHALGPARALSVEAPGQGSVRLSALNRPQLGWQASPGTAPAPAEPDIGQVRPELPP